LFQSATELGARQVEIVPQNEQERRRRIAIDIPRFAVNRECQ
jgi:hypothetical protein